MSGYYQYDGTNNEVTHQDQMEDFWIDDFFLMKPANLFHASEHGGSVTVVNPEKEQVVLKEVTVEQAIILFATMLGLKEAARE